MFKAFFGKSMLRRDGKYIKFIRDKAAFGFQELSQELETWLKPENTLLNSFCLAYYRAKPRIHAGQYVAQVGLLYDYKAFCFSGVPHYFYVATDHFPWQLSNISFYDLDWNRLDVRYGEHPNCDVERPKHFKEILYLAKAFSAGFPFARVDFFDLEEKAYLAEMNFYPGGGEHPITRKALIGRWENYSTCQWAVIH